MKKDNAACEAKMKDKFRNEEAPGTNLKNPIVQLAHALEEQYSRPLPSDIKDEDKRECNFVPLIFEEEFQNPTLCRPSILSLNTYIVSYGCHTQLLFSYDTVRAPFNLSRFPSLKWACMWSIECVCSSLQSVIMVIFFYWHHAIGSKCGPPRF